MAFNKIKKFIAMGLVVSLTIPAINVQALDMEQKTNNTSQIESENLDIESGQTESGQTEIRQTDEENKADEKEAGDKIQEETKIDLVEKKEEETNVSEKETEEKESNIEVDTANEEASTNIEDNLTEKVSEEKNIKEDETTSKDKKEENLKGKKYSTKKAKTSTEVAASVRSFKSTSIIDEPEEYKIKKQELEDLEVLVPMTDSKYELTLANDDGSYEYVESYDDFNKAKTAAINLDNSSEIKESQVPAVVSNSGNIVYATNQMGRMLISVNNLISYSGVVNIYPTSDLKTAFTYVNVGSMEDVPVLDMTDKAAKVMINGYVGWIANNISSGTYNMKLVPLTKSINPSYYTVSNGDLIHFLSYNLEEGNRGASLTVGKAPSYLKEGVKYLSYDGNYFYEYNSSNLSTKLNTLVGDYRTGSRMASVNKSNPFYNYYQYLPFRSKTVYSAADLDRYLANNTASNSKLRGTGSALKESETKYGVNAILALAVGINESGFGTSYYSLDRNNLFGMGAVDSNPNAAYSYKTPGESILAFTKDFISDGYSDPADWRYYGGFLGHKDRGANVKYASDPYWGEKAAQHAYSIDKYLSGGNSNLKELNSKQIGMAISNNSVITSNGSLLYNITSDLSQYASYTNIPFVINDMQRVTISGKTYYSINPEITNPLHVNGSVKDFDGNYKWMNGYVLASNVRLLNVYLPQVSKVSGDTRYETAIALSKSKFSTSDSLVLVNGEAIIDGVSATPLASGVNAPILLTTKKGIPDSVKNEIKRLSVKNVLIVGGADVVSANVVNELKKMGITNITRLSGETRYETALEVAKYIDKNLYDVENIVVAGGYGEADALSISPVTVREKMPIILVKNNEIPATVNSWLKSEAINNAYVIGSTTVVSNKVLTDLNNITSSNITNNRLGGADRYETNAKVIEKFYGSEVNSVYVTVGRPLADALGAGVIAGLNNSPVILTDKDLSSTQKSVMKNKTANRVIQVGGTVSQTSIQNLRDLLSRTQ